MLAVNLGTRGVEAARDLVEYCNAPAGTASRIGGRPTAIASRTGSGPGASATRWTVRGRSVSKTAVEYGRRAAEAGKVMRLVDPSIELVACGSSGPTMPTFGAWEATVLELAWD